MRAVIICHHDEALNRELLPAWLASFTDLAGIVVIRENRETLKRRIGRERKRLGNIRMIDVLLFRLFYRIRLAKRDRDWEANYLLEHGSGYPPLPDSIPVLEVSSPNHREAMDFIQTCKPDLVLARCKHLLKPEVFEIPPLGTYVLHPGICPEYRNAHGCFWALVNRDMNKVGATLLKIDRGIDTGPIYNYFSYPFDESSESHIRIQNRVVFENLDAIKKSLLDIDAGRAEVIDISTRSSRNWGQPWLTAWFKWKRAAGRAKNGKQ